MNIDDIYRQLVFFARDNKLYEGILSMLYSRRLCRGNAADIGLDCDSIYVAECGNTIEILDSLGNLSITFSAEHTINGLYIDEYLRDSSLLKSLAKNLSSLLLAETLIII